MQIGEVDRVQAGQGGGAIDRVIVAVGLEILTGEPVERAEPAEDRMGERRMMRLSPAPAGGVLAIGPDEVGQGPLQSRGDGHGAAFRLGRRQIVAPGPVGRHIAEEHAADRLGVPPVIVREKVAELVGEERFIETDDPAVEDQRLRLVAVGPEIPVAQQIEHLRFEGVDAGRARCRELDELRKQAPRRERQRIRLQPRHAVQRDRAGGGLSGDGLDDAVRAIGRIEAGAHEIGIVGRPDVVVGGGDDAVPRIGALRQLQIVEQAIPVVGRLGAGHRHLASAFERATHRDAAGGEEADPLAIGIDDVLHRAIEQAEGGAELAGILRAIHAIERLRRANAAVEAGPGEGDDLIRPRDTGGAPDIGDHRPVPRRAHREFDVRRAADLDGFLPRFEGTGSEWRHVAVGLAVRERLDEEVLIVGDRGGKPPGDVVVLAEQHEGDAGRRRARHAALRRLDTRQIPLDREPEAEMRVVRQHRMAGVGQASGDDPAIGGAGQRRQARKSGGSGAPGGGGVDRALDGLRQRRGPEGFELGGGKLAGESGTQPFVLPVAAELIGHEPAPEQRVLGTPGLRLGAQQIEFGRPGAAMPADIGVHPVAIGAQQRLQRRRLAREAPLCERGEAEQPHHAIGFDRRRADDFGEPSAREAALELHLEKPVARVEIAEREGRVAFVAGVDRRHAGRVEADLDRLRETRQNDLAVMGRKRAPEPEP